MTEVRNLNPVSVLSSKYLVIADPKAASRTLGAKSASHKLNNMKHPVAHTSYPRITEKGAYLSEQGAYVFNVAKDANKKEIAEAIRTIFKVTPRMVRVMSLPTKQGLYSRHQPLGQECRRQEGLRLSQKRGHDRARIIYPYETLQDHIQNHAVT
jgi:ribosomal protein L23